MSDHFIVDIELERSPDAACEAAFIAAVADALYNDWLQDPEEGSDELHDVA